MESIDTLVVGAGVIGLACADALAAAGREVVVVEAEPIYGSGVSARNSEVVHSGIYYPPGSTKAAVCVRGRRLLYAFCEAHGVMHRRCGKLVVAADEGQRAELEKLLARGVANGVEDLRLLERAVWFEYLVLPGDTPLAAEMEARPKYRRVNGEDPAPPLRIYRRLR